LNYELGVKQGHWKWYTTRKFWYGFLFTLHSNYGRIIAISTQHERDRQTRRTPHYGIGHAYAYIASRSKNKAYVHHTWFCCQQSYTVWKYTSSSTYSGQLFGCFQSQSRKTWTTGWRCCHYFRDCSAGQSRSKCFYLLT